MPYRVSLPPQIEPIASSPYPKSLVIPVIPVTNGENTKDSTLGDPLPIRAWVVEAVGTQDGILQAVKICSDLLEDQLWLVIDRSFTPADDWAIYYPEELPLLKDKTIADLRQIHEAKLAFRGSRIIQEGAEAPR